MLLAFDELEDNMKVENNKQEEGGGENGVRA